MATGAYRDADTFGKAHDKLKEVCGWMIYERGDDKYFDSTLRLWTGTLVDENVAKYYTAELKGMFGCTIYVKQSE
ncbi:hypothetical protein H0266_14635 [Halobacillus locisalis]|uniref:Uncharacterized protein n=1 Tax=Halobacillus locisalis TaxID=220753 RepID=A0A838CVY9_9BACI|nr:hypothetical protein [Halobacillus locisalis]MBA2176130.1 hypothetical protein [Halobacillus locisalis]